MTILAVARTGDHLFNKGKLKNKRSLTACADEVNGSWVLHERREQAERLRIGPTISDNQLEASRSGLNKPKSQLHAYIDQDEC